MLADALRPVLPGLAEEIISAIGREVPDYARPLEGPFGRALRVGVERALRRFVDDLVDPAAPDDDAREIYVTLGRGEMRAGRSLDALLSAYRLGARIAWERCVQAGQAAGHDPETLYRLASAIFSYIDRISAESVEGYADEQSTALAERQRRRRALVRLLARDDAGAEEVRDLAQLAVWPRPASVAGLVARADDGDRLALRLGGEAIAVAEQRRGDRDRPRSRRARPPRRAGGRAGRRAGRAGPDRRRSSAPRGRSRAPRRRCGLLEAGLLPPSPASCSSPTSTCPRCCCTATVRWPPTSRRERSRRCTRSATGSARGSGRRCAPGSTSPARSPASPSACTCTPRPCATGWPSCASCSASASTTPRRASSWRSRSASATRTRRRLRADRRAAHRQVDDVGRRRGGRVHPDPRRREAGGRAGRGACRGSSATSARAAPARPRCPCCARASRRRRTRPDRRRRTRRRRCDAAASVAQRVDELAVGAQAIGVALRGPAQMEIGAQRREVARAPLGVDHAEDRVARTSRAAGAGGLVGVGAGRRRVGRGHGDRGRRGGQSGRGDEEELAHGAGSGRRAGPPVPRPCPDPTHASPNANGPPGRRSASSRGQPWLGRSSRARSIAISVTAAPM